MIAGAVGLAGTSTHVIAADHHEADTAASTDDSADIGDLYAFHSEERLTIILTFDGYLLVSDAPEYDPDVLYGIHIDTNGDNVADHDIWVRFGQNSVGEWGAQFEGLPGSDAPLVGAVDTAHRDEDSETDYYAGFRDDPFFFDVEGFNDTLMTGDLSFDPNRDFVTLKNTMAIAVEFPHEVLGSDDIAVWATTGRREG